ncbi:MAG: MFS family permease [Planctomycetota bacterium]|jgi:MFS family permease
MVNKIQTQGKLYYGWWVLLSCTIGLIVGPGQFAFGSLGLFIIPLHDEFGWSRYEISLSTTIFTFSLIFFMPIVGKLVDRFGSKEVLLPSMLIIGLSLATIPLVLSQLWHLLAIFFIMGSLGAAANSLPFMLAISSWFDKRRGVAIGIAMAGSGLGYAAVPPVIQYVNSTFGWHFGYYTLAAIILLFAIPIIVILFRNKPAEMGLLPDGVKDLNDTENTKQELSGMNRHAALRDRNFWLLVIIFSMIAFCLFGLLIHIIPMLSDRGMSRADAAKAASLIGITILIVRVPIGYLMDRMFAPRVAQCCFLISTLGIAILASGASGFSTYIAAILVGFSIGAEIDLLAFLTGRYFGLKNYGEVFGMLFASMMLGVSLGPPTFGFCFDTMGDYSLVLYLSCLIMIAATIITHLLPDYSTLKKA